MCKYCPYDSGKGDESFMSQRKGKTIFSAVQPTGDITIGNYFGAVKNWTQLQSDFNCIFALADLHAITIRKDAEEFKQKTLEAYALLLACEIDVEKSLFFIQSQVNTHCQLAWMLSCYTGFGELARMTQFKDKSNSHSDNVNCGLFSYPVLMLSDILLYRADFVPVGQDQKQHLELTRTVAERFNFLYGPTFKVPEPYIKNGAKIKSLKDPKKKMSKSDPDLNSRIELLDSPDEIVNKVKQARTDSENHVKYGENKDGINNLMTIYSCTTGKTFDGIEKEFDGKGYGEFKAAVAEALIEHLTPIQNKFSEIIKDKSYIEKCYRDSAEEALNISNETLNEVKKKIGFIL